MRHQPALVDRVAREAAAEMIVDAALADMIEADLDRGEVARLAGAQSAPPQQLEQSGWRNFRCAAGAAVDRIVEAAELPCRVVEFAQPDRGAAVAARRCGEPLH